MKTFFKKIRCIRPESYLLLGLLLIFLLYPDIVHAAEKSAVDELNENLAAAFKWILSVIFPVVWLIIGFTGSLMDNTFIMNPEIESMLRLSWQTIRNLVNIMFVLILLGIALYNILGRSEGNFVLKTVLPKFVIALLAVNFSFFIGKTILDLNNLATTAVFSIPAGVLKSQNIQDLVCFEYADTPEEATEIKAKGQAEDVTKKEIFASDKTEKGWYKAPCRIPRYIYLNITEEILVKDKDKPQEYTYNKQVIRFDKEKQKLTPSLFNQNTFGLVLAYNIFRIQDMIDVAHGNNDLSKLTINAFFAIMLLIIYGAVFIAIVLVLLGRAAVIWISLALAPLVALFYVLEGVFQIPEGLDIKTKFFKHAFAPFILSVPIALSFILLNAATSSELIDLTCESPGCNALTGGNITTMTISAGGATKGLDDARAILWYIAVVVLLWTGVKQAASGTVVEGMVGTVMDKVRDAGTFVAKLPAYLPIIPVSPTKRTSIMGLSEAWNRSKTAMSGIAGKHAENINLPWLKSVQASLDAMRDANDLKGVHAAYGDSLATGIYKNNASQLASTFATSLNRHQREATGEKSKYISGLKNIGFSGPITSTDAKTTWETPTIFIDAVIQGEEKAVQRFTELLSTSNNFRNFASGAGISAEKSEEIAQDRKSRTAETAPTATPSVLGYIGQDAAKARDGYTEAIRSEKNSDPTKQAATMLDATADQMPNVHESIKRQLKQSEGTVLTLLGTPATVGTTTPDEKNTAQFRLELVDNLVKKSGNDLNTYLEGKKDALPDITVNTELMGVIKTIIGDKKNNTGVDSTDSKISPFIRVLSTS